MLFRSYTRDGTFQVNENGEIVTVQGFLVDPGLTIPSDATDIEINLEGEVLVSTPGSTAMTNVGQIQIANFINPAGLEAIGDNLLLETDASGSPTVGNPNEDEFGTIRQSMLEQSNVNIVQEMTNLITAQRSYEMNSNIISTSDEMLQTVSQLR